MNTTGEYFAAIRVGDLSRVGNLLAQDPGLANARIRGEQPETFASVLAEAAGIEKQWFKSNVRKLKELGLTESLAVGYRLSPRGRAFLDFRVRVRKYPAT